MYPRCGGHWKQAQPVLYSTKIGEQFRVFIYSDCDFADVGVSPSK